MALLVDVAVTLLVRIPDIQTVQVRVSQRCPQSQMGVDRNSLDSGGTDCLHATWPTPTILPHQITVTYLVRR